MTTIIARLLAGSIIIFSLVGRGVAAQTSLPDGTLVRAEGETRLYVIDDGERRWIDAPGTLRAHGLTSPVAVISSTELSLYPEGEPLSASSRFVIAGEEAVLPDLSPLAAYDLRFGTVNGRTVIRFTSAFWNQGKGKFELLSHPRPGSPVDSEEDSFQRIVRLDGSARERLVGHFKWHSIHYHFHFSDFVDYILEPVSLASGDAQSVAPVKTQKTSFCMRDNGPIDLSLAGAPKSPVYNICGKIRQGVSVGWADIYGSNLPDQYIDVHELPKGLYKLSFYVDPRNRFLEISRENNGSALLIDLDPAARTAKVVASGSPFATTKNQFPDGMLVRGDARPAVYVIQNNRKRPLGSAEIFSSYGYAWDQVRWFPQGVVDVIPRVMVVREPGTQRLHMLNAAGYRRRLLNPEVFASYGLSPADVADVNAVEFAQYKETDLIRLEGDEAIYSLTAKRFVGTIADLQAQGRDLASVHTVNMADLNAYMVRIAAKDLTIPWDIVFLPDGDMLVTERSGTLRRIGKQPAVIDIASVRHTGEGGLMGMALHPNFASNGLLYLYFTAADTQKNRIVRYRLDGASVVQDKVIFDGIPSALYHDGGQIAFGPDGMLYATTGDAETPDLAQDLSSLGGKTLRLTPDGGIPSDNPFGTAVWSYGHRNAQGIAWDAGGRMWQTEHGRSGALSGLDELNLVEKGKNYGWPGLQGDAQAEGMTPPVRHSGATTTWAPSGIAYADGSLYFAGLRGSALYQAKLGPNGEVTDLKTHLSGKFGRLRAIVLGPDGFLYVSTSNRDGRGTPRPGDDKILIIHQDLLRSAR